jgi:WD40 repeat protein
MDHPHIAKVFDAGTTPDNRPYFVMELVKGTPITKYCDEHRLTPRQRLELFLPVCQALQHAHQKGIIHRDVKPSNVLVAPYDGRPIVKVIDFGVAKAVGQRLTERTLYTEFGTVVGTLEYMSPEQAELNNYDIDTRSDVYSLGVLLYQLLTGTTPLTAERLKETAFLDLLRAIREEEPPRPSTRLSDSRGSLPTISAQRRTEPARLQKLLMGELDWIVMKALEKDRSRRYQTANALARDVQRYLNDETVEARPPSPGYRLGKILRRNKGPAIAVAGILAALVLGLVGTLIFAAGEVEQRRRAGENARLAEEEKKAALNQAYRAHLAAAGAAIQNDDIVDAARQLQGAPEAFRHWEWHHLHTRLDDSTSVFPATAGEFPFLIHDPKGIRIARLTSTGVRLIDLDGNEILTRSVRPEAKLMYRPPLPTRRGLRLVGVDVKSVSINSPFAQFSHSITNHLNLLDDEGRFQAALKGPEGMTALLTAVSPDGGRLAVIWMGPKDWKLTLHDAESGEHRATSARTLDYTWALGFSPDGTRIATAGEDGAARVWDTSTGALIAQCRGHFRKVLSVAFRPDGRRLLTASADGTVRQWDSTTGREIQAPYERHRGEATAAVYSPDGLNVASGGTDRTIRLWEAATRHDTAILHGHTGFVSDLAFAADGRRLVSMSRLWFIGYTYDSTVRLWEVGLQGGESVLRGHTNDIYPVAYSPDGQWIASGSWDKTVRLWDASTGESCAELPHHDVVRVLDFSPDSSRLVSGCDQDEWLHVWNVATAREERKLKGPGTVPQAIAVSPDAARIAAADADGSAIITEAATGERIYSFRIARRDGEKKALAYSPDGRLLAGTGEDSKQIDVWDTRTHDRSARLTGHTGVVYSVAFNGDGRLLASASGDGTVRLWDVATAKCVTVLTGHTDEVFSAVFHPDGKRLASAGRDRAIWLWDLATGQEVARLEGHTNFVFSLAFSPDGTSLVSGSGDGTVRIWDTLPAADRYQARRQAESLRPEADRLVERLFRENNDAAAVAATLRADRELGEPLRHAALRALQRRQIH